MTNFSQIYSDNHAFSDGMIEIANTTANLAKAYIVVNTIDLQEKLEQPFLLGFLYQVDGLKRSRPYPIVSQRQTVSLDLSTCDQFLFVPTNHLIDQYALALWVSSESGGGASVDLSSYALISQLPDLTDYALKSEIPTFPNLSDYALVSQLAELTNYPLRSLTVEPFSWNQSQVLNNVAYGVIGIYEYTPIINVQHPVNLTANNSDASCIVSQSSAYDPSYGGFRLFDGQITNEPDWCSNGGLPQWVSCDLASPKSIAKYSIFPSNIAIIGSNTPKDWQLQGSNNGADWTVVDTRSNVSGWVSNTAKEFSLSSPVSYRYYRLYITANQGGALTRIGELRLMDADSALYVRSDSNYQISFVNSYQTHAVKRLASGSVNALINYV